MATSGLFGVEMPRQRGGREDNLLGMNLGSDVGMTDTSFQNMGRAPVNELWAGRHSAWIDDKLFDEASEEAKKIRNAAIAEKESLLSSQPEFNKINAERQWEIDTRRDISDETMLDVYPGHLNSLVDDPTFMFEFSDKDARFTGMNDQLIKEGGVARLGQVFDHPELYKHYPEAQLIPVVYEDLAESAPGARGAYAPSSLFPGQDIPQGQIYLNNAMPNQDFRETILHELQHYIQQNEGWQNGGMPSTEMGFMYADALENKVDPTSPRAAEISGIPQHFREQSGEIMPFMQNEAMAMELARPSYQYITGEQLARDATERDKAGIQVTDYYDGPIDGEEYSQWHHDDPTYQPSPGSMRVRDFMDERGILGIVDFDTGKLRDGEEPAFDPYLSSYKSLLGL